MMKLKIAIVGAGPISLLKAISLAKENPQAEIVIFDADEKPGGAWKTVLSPQSHEIECGCHIWSFVPAVYQFIETELGIALKPMKPTPQFCGRRISIPYSWHNTIKSYLAFARYMFLFKWKSISHLRNDPAINFRIFNKTNRYPENGSGVLVEKLIERLKLYPTIQFQLKSSVDQIDLQAKPSLQINGHATTFDKIFLTSVSHIKKLITATEEFEITARTTKYVHLLIVLDKPAKQKISYLRMTNHPVVHRITDVSYQTGNKENILLVGIHEKAFDSMNEDEIEQSLQALLIKLKIVDRTYKIIKADTFFYPTSYLTTESMRRLSHFKESITVMRTTDLMHGIYFQLKSGLTI